MEKKVLRVRKLREARYMTQAQLANKMGVQVQTVFNVEAGRYKIKPRASTLVALAKALEVTIDELFEPETD